MAEDPNLKKGSRDISDLKARLGLKKSAPAPTPGMPGAAPGSAGASGQRPLPAPPGFAPPPAAPPAPAPPPDPRRDPFAAAPQAVMYGYGMPLPGSDDGTAAAPMEKPKPWGRILTFAGLSVVTLLAGYVCGRSCAGRENYNMTIGQAADISTEVEKIQRQLTTINDRINKSQAASRNEVDTELAADLGTLDLKDPDNRKIFHTNYFFLEDLAIENLFNYYGDVTKLYRLIRDHSKRTEQDADAIADFQKNSATRGDKNYGVVLDTSGALTLAHFVEVGQPVCPKEGQTDCNANELKGFKYRVDTGGSWFEKPVKGKPGEVIYPMQKTPLFAAVAAGNPNILAVRDHVRRMAEIRLLCQKLVGEQKELLTQLKRAAEKPKVFTF